MDTSSALFTQLLIKGFRRLRDVSLPLRPLSVMIGANGTGKTSVLDVLSLLASSANGKLAASLSELSGLVSVITQGSEAELSFGISMKVTGHEPLDYALSIRPNGLSHEIWEEWLKQDQFPNPSNEDAWHIASEGQLIRYFDPDKKELMAPTWAQIGRAHV